MKLLDKILAKFRKKPEKLPVQAIPGYNYWDYRMDLFTPTLSYDDIIARAGGRIPRAPRKPKPGETWEYNGCTRHGVPTNTYPLRFQILEGQDLNLFLSFVVCGCLHPVEEKS